MPSYEFFNDVDLKGNVLYNAVAHQAASNPAGKADGFWYYNTATRRFMFQQDGVFSNFGASSLQDDTNPILAGPLDTDGNQIRESLGTDVTSQSSLPLPADGNYYRITGNSDVLGIDAIAVGLEVELEFVSVLDLIHHATSFILPTAADISTAAGDTARFREISTGNWKCTGYTRAAGTPLVGGGSSDIVNDLTPQLGGVLDTNAKQVRFSKGADVASAAALAIGDDGNYFEVTGSVAITSIAAKAIGTEIKLRFMGTPTLTHHATNLNLPTGASIVAAVGDEVVFTQYAENAWRCTNYQRASGAALVTAGGNSIYSERSFEGGPVIAGGHFMIVPTAMKILRIDASVEHAGYGGGAPPQITMYRAYGTVGSVTIDTAALTGGGAFGSSEFVGGVSIAAGDVLSVSVTSTGEYMSSGAAEGLMVVGVEWERA